MRRRRARVPAILWMACLAAPALAQTSSWISNGPSLFEVSAVATGSDELVAYASGGDHVANQSAIFRSADGAATWTAVAGAAQGEFFSDILVDPSNSQTIYAGALGTGTNVNLYRSADGGLTWPQTGTVQAYCSPSFSPAGSAVLVSCGTQVMRTNDSGQSWTPLQTPFTEAVRLAPGPAGSVLAYGPTHIFKTTSAGDSWVASGNAPATCPSLNALQVNPTNGNILVGGTGLTGIGGFQCGGVFRSTDGGTTWTASTLSGVYVTDLVLDTANPSRVFASGAYVPGILPKAGAYSSADGGVSWANLQLPTFSATRLALSPSGQILYAATSLGVYTLAGSVSPLSCTQNDQTLCLSGGRYKVTATYAATNGSGGQAHAVSLTGDSGYFWFFDSSNIELIVKVLDACVGGNAHWVFASGLTNVEVHITVTDIVTGATNNYTNPQGKKFKPIQDTSAFSCP